MAKRVPRRRVDPSNEMPPHPPQKPIADLAPVASELAATAIDLTSLRSAVIDAAGVSTALWFSYLFALLYLFIAVLGVNHEDVFRETPVDLPFLSVKLPLLGFFSLGPVLFLTVHTYVLLHCFFLADKVGVFHSELERQIPDAEVRTRLRRQLPSNVFVQFLAGAREVRKGVVGLMLRIIALISLVVAPVVLLITYQVIFLPYQSESLTWSHRLVFVIDLFILWRLWPSIISGRMKRIRDLRSAEMLGSLTGTIFLLYFVIGVVTFPDELMDRLPLTTWAKQQLFGNQGSQDSILSNRLFLPKVQPIDRTKWKEDVDFDAGETTISLKERNFRGAVLREAVLRNADFTSSDLSDADLGSTDLRGVVFEGASLRRASLQDADLGGASFVSANLQQTQFEFSRAPGASFALADLRGTQIRNAKMIAASFDSADLQGAWFEDVNLVGADFQSAQLQGASFNGVHLQGAFLQGAALWRAELDAGYRGDFDAKENAVALADSDRCSLNFSADPPGGSNSWKEWVSSNFDETGPFESLTGSMERDLEAKLQSTWLACGVIPAARIAKRLSDLACDEDGAPFVAQAIVQRLAQGLWMPGRDLGVQSGPFARRLLNPKVCEGASRLNSVDRRSLEKIARQDPFYQ
ncbi:pentapeptide repeat-containing protein [Mesorhizobium onobrychidis]|uniref:Pentapeptide repeat-containing protein n=1 Tax=Mesorhizobium onobrychidis TaxID=2775404 RepID=A0ABY5R781_9HYPH|nr:pentapeptide repeat-containing protein [Mesorhizobium onobrychidis]UVC19336.1 pentapeptide repeat-containing protein [Mesorhizobium onobrychidis]